MEKRISNVKVKVLRQFTDGKSKVSVLEQEFIHCYASFRESVPMRSINQIPITHAHLGRIERGLWTVYGKTFSTEYNFKWTFIDAVIQSFSSEDEEQNPKTKMVTLKRTRLREKLSMDKNQGTRGKQNRKHNFLPRSVDSSLVCF